MYDRRNRHKTDLKAHIIFVTKYRKKLLVGDVHSGRMDILLPVSVTRLLKRLRIISATRDEKQKCYFLHLLQFIPAAMKLLGFLV